MKVLQTIIYGRQQIILLDGKKYRRLLNVTSFYITQREVNNVSTEIIIGVLSLLGTLQGSYLANNRATAVIDEKISILFASDQLTQTQYEELMSMLEA